MSVWDAASSYAYSHKEDELESNASYAYDEFEATISYGEYECNDVMSLLTFYGLKSLDEFEATVSYGKFECESIWYDV